MTRKRNDEHGTEFSNWVREQSEVDSKLGFVATDVDYVWRNYKTHKWMFIEEKRYLKWPLMPQFSSFLIVHNAAKNDANYCGFFLLVFENTTPDDGAILLDELEPYIENFGKAKTTARKITREELIKFLRFES